MTAGTRTEIDIEKLEVLVGSIIGDLGAAASSALVVIGDKLGLYGSLLAGGPVTPDELAAATGLSERYLRHWLLNQAASGYVDYNAANGRYGLTPEQAMVFTTDDTPASLLGAFTLVNATVRDEPRITTAIRTGGGMLWGDHEEGLFSGTARFFRPLYVANIAQNWIPALDGAQSKLEAGAMVADIGCGFGQSTVIMAQAYPRSRFIGFDSHTPSIEAARRLAAAAGVSDRVTFEVATAQDFPGIAYDLVTLFDCLHDMGDPEGAAAHILDALEQSGSVMLVEPMAADEVQGNLNPVGRIFSAASVLVCTPHAIAEGGRPLGTLATDAELEALFRDRGYSSFRRATETPTNRVFEARR